MSAKFQTVLLKADVTAVKIVGDLILAASGSYLHIFSKFNYKYIDKVKIFEGGCCHGIEPNDDSGKILLFGANKVAVFKCDLTLVKFHKLNEYSEKDWIVTAKWATEDGIAALTMHNILILLDSVLEETDRYICEESCILYCGFICCNSSAQFVVLSGTVFSEVLFWKPLVNTKGSCPITQKLKGHKGVIFSIDCIPSLDLICSTSDDRTAMLWRVTGIFNDQESSQASLLCTVYGHTSRIFRCRILQDCFATVGEDSLVNIWNFQGELIKKIVANKGGSTWTLDYDVHCEFLVVGSGDGSIAVTKIRNLLNVLTFDTVCTEKLKRLAILEGCDLGTVTEDGSLYYFAAPAYEKLLIARHAQLKCYALLEVSSCRKLIALASFHGDVYVYKKRKQHVALRSEFKTLTKGRIYSLHWLTCRLLLICEKDGILSVWCIGNGGISFVGLFILPNSKERWTTAACLTDNKSLIVGDRVGNIHVFSFGQIQAVQTIKKAHSYLGVTHLTAKGNTVFSLGKLYKTNGHICIAKISGRNGILKTYTLENTLVQNTSDKLPFSWLAKLEQFGDSHFLQGFNGKDFVIWDCEGRRIILQHTCGGGHRSWDFHRNGDTIMFAYLKEQFVNIVSTDWLRLCPINITKGLHSVAINALQILPAATGYSQCVLLSGGEDTTFQVSTLDLQKEDANSLLNTVEVLKSHLSSIRTIAACIIRELIAENDSKVVQYLVFSAGGRAQIVLWLLTAEMQGEVIKCVSCCEKDSFYEPLKNEESEMRVMDLTSIKSGDEVVLFAACSDGKVKMFTVSCREMCSMKLVVARSFAYKTRCILKICNFEISERKVLATMSTDGKILFWNVEDLMADANSQPFAEIAAHQSGINSYSYEIKENFCFFITGGDDNAIVLHVFNFTADRCLTVIAKYVDTSSHCAQITGAFITDTHFITTSIDQKVLIFRWCYTRTLSAKLIGQYKSSIADIQGIRVFRSSVDVMGVVLYGKGIEILKVQINV